MPHVARTAGRRRTAGKHRCQVGATQRLASLHVAAALRRLLFRSSYVKVIMGHLPELVLLPGAGCQGLVDLAGGVALEAAVDLSGGLAFGGAPGYVGLGARVGGHPVKTIRHRAELACRLLTA